MRSDAVCADRERFIGEHRAELERRDGRGAAAQAAQRRATHLAAWLGVLGREIPASFQLYGLMPTYAACLKQESLLVSLFTLQRAWLHFIRLNIF